MRAGEGSVFRDQVAADDLVHHEGIHTVTERCKRSYSLDKGETWHAMECWFHGFNAYQRLDGRKCCLELWEYHCEPKDTFSVKRIELNPDGQKYRASWQLLTFQSLVLQQQKDGEETED